MAFKKILLAVALFGIGFTSFSVYAAAPLPPTNVRAEAGDEKVTVYFTPDVSTSFDLTTEYTVSTVVSGPAPVQVETGKSSPITMSGLVNGQTYKFVVTAKNKNGTSVKSAESNSVFPAATGKDIGDTTNVPPPAGGGNDTNIHIRYVNPIQANNVQGFIAKVIDSAVLLLTPIIVIMILWTGFLFISARGNPEEIGNAKKALLYTLIGATIVLIAKGFSLAIKDIFSQF